MLYALTQTIDFLFTDVRWLAWPKCKQNARGMVEAKVIQCFNKTLKEKDFQVEKFQIQMWSW